VNTVEETVTRIDLLRHGACEGGDIYRGSIDVELSAEGWRQMRQAVEPLGHWQRVITSPLMRCRRFAEQYSENNGVPVLMDERWREMSFGEWEGQKVSDVWRTSPDLIRAYYENPLSVTPPGGEPMMEVQSRIVSAWNALLDNHSGEHILLVIHSGVIRLLLAHLLNMPLASIFTLDVPYASLSRLKVFHGSEGQTPVLISHNPFGAEAVNP
jgi:broad specificity phosphatase PhoE